MCRWYLGGSAPEGFRLCCGGWPLEDWEDCLSSLDGALPSPRGCADPRSAELWMELPFKSQYARSRPLVVCLMVGESKPSSDSREPSRRLAASSGRCWSMVTLDRDRFRPTPPPSAGLRRSVSICGSSWRLFRRAKPGVDEEPLAWREGFGWGGVSAYFLPVLAWYSGFPSLGSLFLDSPCSSSSLLPSSELLDTKTKRRSGLCS